jgi:DNA mismatch repair protein MutS
MSKSTYFVPNDCYLTTSKNVLSLITGPNMAGKSTYMRQNALIVMMAQMGSFVPASSARIGLVDKIFTRIGASDDLAGGRSTFMLEMTEVASILKNATSKSLILYDEIGRGTSTYDGMSIAQAVIEYTVKKIGAKTLFATHYHELTDLEFELEGVVNYNITAKKRGEEVVFLRKIVRGAAESSYGIEVGQLAGLPKEVINKAKKVLSLLEAQGVKRKKENTDVDENVSFEDISELSIIDRLKETDINTITPIEAMSLLYELKKAVE